MGVREDALEMVPEVRIERCIPRLTDRCSEPLSYSGHFSCPADTEHEVRPVLFRGGANLQAIPIYDFEVESTSSCWEFNSIHN
jgi:hypothetical protein